MKKICNYIGFLIIGFSLVFWFYPIEAFKNFVEISGNYDIWGIVLKVILSAIGVLVAFLDYFMRPREKYLRVLEDEETGIQVSERALNSLIIASLKNNVEGVELKSCRANEINGEIKVFLTLEFLSTENVNEVSKKIIDLIKRELSEKVGISNVKVHISVHKLSFQA